MVVLLPSQRNMDHTLGCPVESPREVMAPETPAEAVRRASAHEFDQVCRLIDPPTNTNVARRLTERMNRKVTRWAVAAWRRGDTAVTLEVMIHACQLGGAVWHVELDHQLA